MRIKLTILGIPMSKQSVKKGKYGFYQPKEIKDEEKSIKAQIISQIPADFNPFVCGVRVLSLDYVFPPLKNFSKKKLQKIAKGEIIYKVTKPDLNDNLNKILFDIMQGIVFYNDSQVCEYAGNVRKIYGFKPRIEIELEEIKDEH